MDASLPKRDSSLDLIRIMAVFFVVSVHCLLKNGFYEIPVTGTQMYLLCIARGLFMSSVPLFLLLTGFLMTRKTLSARYYRGIGHTLGVYVLACLVSILFRMWYRSRTFTLSEFLLGFTDFTHVPYAWYIQMYIGLYLLIPFLNLIYHGLSSKRQKQCLVMTCLLLTALPPVANMFKFSGSPTLKQLLMTEGTDQLLPDFWLQCYPVTYYFIGSYLREYPIKLKKRYLAPLLAAHLLLTGTFVYYRNLGEKFARTPWLRWESAFNVITAVLLFAFFVQLPTVHWHLNLKKLLNYFAGLSLGTYLISWIFDLLFYQRATALIPDARARQIWNPVLVLCVFLCATAASALMDLVIRGIRALASGRKHPDLQRR